MNNKKVPYKVAVFYSILYLLTSIFLVMAVIKAPIKKLPALSAFIALMIKKKKKVKEWPFKWYSNEVCRYFSGIDIGWTFNPKHLFKKTHQI